MPIKQKYYPDNISTGQNLLEGDVATKLSIQAPVGTVFTFNKVEPNSGIDITIGYSGIYEIFYPGIMINSVELKTFVGYPIYIDYSTDNFVSNTSTTQSVTSQTDEDDGIPMAAIDADGQEGGGQ